MSGSQPEFRLQPFSLQIRVAITRVSQPRRFNSLRARPRNQRVGSQLFVNSPRPAGGATDHFGNIITEAPINRSAAASSKAVKTSLSIAWGVSAFKNEFTRTQREVRL